MTTADQSRWSIGSPRREWRRATPATSKKSEPKIRRVLALNLAYDIINGKKNVEQARKEYGEIAKAEMSGKKHD